MDKFSAELLGDSSDVQDVNQNIESDLEEPIYAESDGEEESLTFDEEISDSSSEKESDTEEEGDNAEDEEE